MYVSVSVSVISVDQYRNGSNRPLDLLGVAANQAVTLFVI